MRQLQNRYIWLPLLRVNPPTEGFPLDDLRKIFRGCQRMVKVPNGVKTLQKISTNVTDRRQTDERTGDSI